MLHKSAVILAFLLLWTSISASTSEELYFRFVIKERKEISQVTKLVSIEDVHQDSVYAIGTQAQVERLQALGYKVELLTHPSLLAEPPKMSSNSRDIQAWDTYPTYSAYVQMMNDFQTNYPSICRTISAGTSVQGRQLLFVKISDNVDSQEAEPEVMYTSTMHGDETTGYILMLRMIDSILTTYSTDAAITDMVNNMEIWINPLANPDGTYRTGDNSVGGATRGNANLVDLNRNFPDPQDGDHPDGHVWQPETIAMMNVASQQSWIISANFHGGAEVVNYPWDTWVTRHADDAWYIDASRQYAESCQAHAPVGYMNDLNDGITHGFDWYEVNGGRQDYMNYWRGCREVTIELSNVKLLSAGQLPAHWNYNRISLFDWFRQASYGIRGVVTDSVTGAPLQATISVVGHDADSSEVYTAPDVGDYYRMIEAGTYTLRFIAPGYFPKDVAGISVYADSSVTVNVQMSEGWICGDIDNNGQFQAILELTYLVDRIFRGGPPPPNLPAADVNGDGVVANILDLTYMVDYIFRGGPDPNCL